MEPMSAPEQRKYALATAGVALVLLVAGWLIGSAGGADIDAAKAAGAKAGTVVGKKEGTRQGFKSGYKKGYRTSYKAAYLKAKRGD